MDYPKNKDEKANKHYIIRMIYSISRISTVSLYTIYQTKLLVIHSDTINTFYP